MTKLNRAQAHLLWMVCRPLIYNINRRGYNISACSYNGENCKKNILEHFDSGCNCDDFKMHIG
jgi:hypothetical protein